MFRTAFFLNENVGRPFKWGEWDCNLFVADLLDFNDGDQHQRSQTIRGKYNNRSSAIRFQKNFTPAPQWMEQQGYCLINTDQFQDHDIILEAKKSFWAASLFFSNRTWAVIEEQGLMMNVVEPGQHMVARYKYG
jgi:hypothetical protein